MSCSKCTIVTYATLYKVYVSLHRAPRRSRFKPFRVLFGYHCKRLCKLILGNPGPPGSYISWKFGVPLVFHIYHWGCFFFARRFFIHYTKFSVPCTARKNSEAFAWIIYCPLNSKAHFASSYVSSGIKFRTRSEFCGCSICVFVSVRVGGG